MNRGAAQQITKLIMRGGLGDRLSRPLKQMLLADVGKGGLKAEGGFGVAPSKGRARPWEGLARRRWPTLYPTAHINRFNNLICFSAPSRPKGRARPVLVARTISALGQ